MASEIQFNSLPTEMLLHCFQFLDPSSLNALSQTDKKLNALASDKSLWQPVFNKYNLKNFAEGDNINYKFEVIDYTRIYNDLMFEIKNTRVVWQFDMEPFKNETELKKLEVFKAKEYLNMLFYVKNQNQLDSLLKKKAKKYFSNKINNKFKEIQLLLDLGAEPNLMVLSDLTTAGCPFALKKRICLRILENNKSLKFNNFPPDDLRKDKDVALLAVQTYCGYLVNLPDFKNDREFIKEALKLNPNVIVLISPEFQDDEEIVLIALEQNRTLLNFASDRLRNDQNFIDKMNRLYLANHKSPEVDLGFPWEHAFA